MDEKFANAEKILAGKELHPNGKKIFDSVLKKSVSIKQHSVK